MDIVIRDEFEKVLLDYKIEQFVYDFSEALANEKIPFFSNTEAKKELYLRVSESCIRKFKNKTKTLPAQIK